MWAVAQPLTPYGIRASPKPGTLYQGSVRVERKGADIPLMTMIAEEVWKQGGNLHGHLWVFGPRTMMMMMMMINPY